MLSSYLSHDTFAHMQIFTHVSWSIKWTCFSEGILYTLQKGKKNYHFMLCTSHFVHIEFRNLKLFSLTKLSIVRSSFLSRFTPKKNNHWFYSILLFFLILVHHDTIQHAALGGPVTYSSKKRSGFMPWGSCVNRRQRPLLKTTDAYMISTYLLKYIGRKLQTETPEI